MISLKLLALILFPIPAISQRCSSIQSVIQLRPSATTSSSRYVVIANGKYYLIGAHNQKNKHFEPSGYMPHHFKKTRITVLVDNIRCNEPEYYLMSLQTFAPNGRPLATYYTTLDLMNWNHSTQWSKPALITRHPMFASDRYIQLLTQMKPNLVINDIVSMVFYLEQLKTIYVVIKSFESWTSDEVKTSDLIYFSVDTRNACEKRYKFSNGFESFKTAMNSVIQPLDTCFADSQRSGSDVLLYCLGADRFQVNEVNTDVKNGSLRTQLVDTMSLLPTSVDFLANICFKSKAKAHEYEIRSLMNGMFKAINEEKPQSTQTSLPMDSDNEISKPLSKGYQKIEKTIRERVGAKEAEESSMALTTVFICFAVILIVLIGILVATARKRNRIARM